MSKNSRLICAAWACSVMCISLRLTAAAEAKPTLKVYTYDSFVAEWGPGPDLKRSFEGECACVLQWVPVADGAAMLARLQVEGNSTKADVLLGIDDSLQVVAEKTGMFEESGIKLSNSLIPGGYVVSSKFVPYDFGYYAFMFDTKAKRKSGKPFVRPKSMDELLAEPGLDRSIIIQDPRTSAPGLGLLLWFHALYGQDANKKLEILTKKVLTVGNGWSDSYNLFIKGEAPIVFSYTTSEAYHRESEKTDRYQVLHFAEGHYLAIETAAIVKTSKQKALATKFLNFLIQAQSQATIASKNWMYPVTGVKKGLPAAYKALKTPAKSLRISPEEVDKHRREWTLQWMEAFKK